jgi:hypothetical protein
MDRETAKRTVMAEIDRRADDLLRVSHEIHAHPELAYEEHFAHDVLLRVFAPSLKLISRSLSNRKIVSRTTSFGFFSAR